MKKFLGCLILVITMLTIGMSALGEEATLAPEVLGEEVTLAPEALEHMERFYNSRNESLITDAKKYGFSMDDPLIVQGINNLKAARELNIKALTTCAMPYSCVSIIKNANKPERMCKEYHDSAYGMRKEEYTAGTLSMVEVFDKTADVYYNYSVTTDRLEKITNATARGYVPFEYRLNCFDTNRNNAHSCQSVIEQTEYNGIPSVLFSFKEAEIYNAVWFDAERGVLLCELQENDLGRFETTFEVQENQTFNPIIFTFDASKPSAEDLLNAQ